MRVVWLGVAWVVLGCGPVVGQEGSTSGSTTVVDPSTTFASTTIASTTTTGTTSTSTSGTTIDPSADDSVGDTDGSFIMEPDAEGGDDLQCDPWAQDCPEDEKCTPWANDGGMSWNALRCSPIGPGMPGDSCVVEGSAVSGLDDCELASMCWNVDPETNTGTCVAFCIGSEANPLCEDASAHCVIANEGVLILCLPCCDPRMPSCIEGQRCLPLDDFFACVPVPDEAPVPTGAACDSLGDCAAGFCADATAVPGCTSTTCCTPWCTLGDDASCDAALPGTVCKPWLADGARPHGCNDTTLGYCALPM